MNFIKRTFQFDSQPEIIALFFKNTYKFIQIRSGNLAFGSLSLRNNLKVKFDIMIQLLKIIFYVPFAYLLIIWFSFGDELSQQELGRIISKIRTRQTKEVVLPVVFGLILRAHTGCTESNLRGFKYN